MRDGANDYKQLVPMGLVSNPGQMANLNKAVKGLGSSLGGNTGLYDTIWAAYQSAQADYTPGQVSSVTLLTDGRNDDPSGGLTLGELTQKLTEARDPKRPVRITTIAIGPDVDTASLDSIAKLSSGRVYSAKTPQDISGVLSQSMFDRS